MKIIVTALALTFSTQAFAITDAFISNYCLSKGKEKIAAQAAVWNCQVDLGQVEVESIDNQWLNPSKYVWYQVKGECNGYDRLVKMVQYYKGRCI